MAKRPYFRNDRQKKSKEEGTEGQSKEKASKVG
jgi:hypothetical protein